MKRPGPRVRALVATALGAAAFAEALRRLLGAETGIDEAGCTSRSSPVRWHGCW